MDAEEGGKCSDTFVLLNITEYMVILCQCQTHEYLEKELQGEQTY